MPRVSDNRLAAVILAGGNSTPEGNPVSPTGVLRLATDLQEARADIAALTEFVATVRNARDVTGTQAGTTLGARLFAMSEALDALDKATKGAFVKAPPAFYLPAGAKRGAVGDQVRVTVGPDHPWYNEAKAYDGQVGTITEFCDGGRDSPLTVTFPDGAVWNFRPQWVTPVEETKP